MKKIILSLIIVMVAALAFAAAPTVTNVVATPGPGQVTITYTLAADTDCDVQLTILNNNDQNYEFTPSSPAVTGDIGSGITTGEKTIIWRPALDQMPAACGYRAKVTADDGVFVPENFVFVPGGTFTMGDTRGEGWENELPTHSVTLGSFYMGKYEVTQSEWQAVMGSNPASGYGVGANYPVYYVSWYAILKYCNLRSMAEGLTPVYSISGSTNPANWGNVPTSNNATWNAAICNFSANGYHLPTEAEWEYTARGATNTPDYLYSGSDDINAVAWNEGNNTPSGTKPVGSKAPNALGLYDMSGNLWEWCWDWYSSSYYSSSPSDNPTGPASGSSRVIRGGGWDESANYCRVASRFNVSPYGSNYYIGFRLCRAVL